MNKYIVTVTLLLTASISQASILTFDGLAGLHTPRELVDGDTSNRGTDYIQFHNGVGNLATAKIGGFDIIAELSRIEGPTAYTDSDGKAYNGTDTFLSWNSSKDNPYDTLVTFQRQNEELFDFYSADLGISRSGPYPNAGFLVTGVFENGGIIQQSVFLDDIPNHLDTDGNDFENFAFEGFTNLKSLRFARSSDHEPYIYNGKEMVPQYGIMFDNFETSADLTNMPMPNTAIPEPITLSLFSLGLGIVAIRRKNIFS